MFDLVTLLMAAGRSVEAPPSGPIVDTVSHTVNLTVNCPTADNVTAEWTMSNIQSGDKAKVYLVEDGGAPQFLVEKDAAASDSHDFTWGEKQGIDETISFQIRVEGVRGGELVSSLLSTASNEDVASGDCPGGV